MTERSICIIWEFIVNPACREKFFRIYGPHGDWAQLMARHPGYLGTQLQIDNQNTLRFLTIDRWKSLSDWQQFKKDFAAEYQAMDQDCTSLTERELFIGHFSEQP